MLRNIFGIFTKKVGIKFAFTTAIITVIILSFFSYLEVTESKQNRLNELKVKTETLTNITVKAISDPLWNYNISGLKLIADGLFNDRDIAYIIVHDSDNKKVHEKNNEGNEYQKDDIITTKANVTYSNTMIGSVEIGFTKYFIRQDINDITMGKLAQIILIAICLLIVISIISFIITKPIKLLSKGTDEIAAGNLTKQIIIKSHDEIGQLAMKFNNMSRNLYNMIRELDESAIALTASQEKFSKAFQTSAEVIGITRLSDQHIIEVNNTFFETFGYSKDDVINYSSDDFELWESQDERDYVFEVLKSQKSIRNMDIRWKTKSGEVRTGIWSSDIIDIAGEKCILFSWNDISERKKAEEALRDINERLEIKVEERTQDLNAMNQELTATNQELFSTLEMLKNTQEHLIRTEKMAALGTLVAGIAHEINTPIGISITAASFLKDIDEKFSLLYKSGNAKKQDLENFLLKTNETATMIYSNLERAANLIKSFKQVSVDQSNEQGRVFKIREYLEELLVSLHPKLKKTKHQVIIKCEKDITIDSYPGAIAQIITNLVMNSLIHAYEPEDEGTITIEAVVDNHVLMVKYSDDGKGMDDEVQSKIFEPFFTTKRNTGGTGLGLHVIYNIVTLQLGGVITCKSELNKGTSFNIEIPLKSGKKSMESM